MSRFAALLFYLALLLVSIGVAAFALMSYMGATRGIESNFPAIPRIVGTNAALEQYIDDADLERALDALQRAGITHVRQYFPWREIERERGTYEWEMWDRIVEAARARNLEIVAVLTTAPAWSQREHEREMPNAPPDDFAEYARFVRTFAERYGDAITYYQIWDEPNVEPNWGKRNADAVEYAALLKPAAEQIRATDADAKILLAGLAMNLELHRPHPNYSEILFLRGLYEIGAQTNWDIVAAKPYGMWTGPEDRTVNSGVLNFSRLVLLRDEMRQYGDAAKPVWAVEMGWNALPEGWTGEPSPWGTDTEEKQADRLERALERTQSEWGWVTGEFPLVLQPNVPTDDARWGFALLGADGEPREAFETIADFIEAPPAPVPPPALPVIPLIALAGVAVVSGWRVWHLVFAMGLDAQWRGFKTRANALPEIVQWVAVVLAAAAFYFSPNALLNLGLAALLVGLFALRLDIGLTLTIFVIPFWNFPKVLFGGFELSPVEVLTWIATAAFLLNLALNRVLTSERLRATVGSLSALDWAVLAFFVLGLLSTRWAGNFGVASREFRIVVLDPILLYAMIRAGAAVGVTAGATPRYVSALMASGVAVCVIGLYQYLTGNVILADGVARLTAVWGSPNNVGLYLERLLPIALAFAFLLHNGETKHEARIPLKWQRLGYAGLVALFAVTILLTYSRGALFLGVPSSVLFVMVVLFTQSHQLSRRTWLAIGATVVVAAIAIVPFLSSDRFGSVLQTGTGTGFFRIAVWTSAVNMIRDHPLLGVGLDNFLYEYPKYILPEAWREPNLSHPHNFILDFWVRLGIGGILIFGWMLIAFYKRAWGAFTNAKDSYMRALYLGLMASVVATLAHGLIDSSFFVIDLAYLFLLTLALTQKNSPFQNSERRAQANEKSAAELFAGAAEEKDATH